MSKHSCQLPAILAGELRPVVAIAQQRTGTRPSPFTVMRWCKKGLKGGTIKLKAAWVGRQWVTTPEAYDEFLAMQTAARLNEPEPTVSDDELKAAGLL